MSHPSLSSYTLRAALSLTALALAGLHGACSSTHTGEAGPEPVGQGASSGGGTTSSGGTTGSSCTGACENVGEHCTIDPPSGSLAPSVLCTCAENQQWCCAGQQCAAGSGGTTGSGGATGQADSGSVGGGTGIGTTDSGVVGGDGGTITPGGACATDCAAVGLVCCDGTCVNIGNDILNCGGCGNICPDATPYCGSGVCGTPPCQAACTTGTTCCGSQCCTTGQLCCDVTMGPVALLCTTPVNGTCPAGSPYAVCSSPDARIATPRGEVAIAALLPGDLVYSVDDGAVVVVPVLAVHRTPVHAHHVIRVTLAGGRVVEMSAGHPTVDGRSFGELRPGAMLGEAAVIAAERVPYSYDYTYDILPASKTGAYFAEGALVGSTLARSAQHL